MSEKSDVQRGFLATEDLHNTNKNWPAFVIIEGSLLIRHEDSTMSKIAPGVMVTNLDLTPEQKMTLKPVEYRHDGNLNFELVKDD